MPKQQKHPVIGFHYGRSDLERIGLFAEMSYMNGKGYVRPYVDCFNEESIKDRQLIPGFPKSKSATDDGYFSSFVRIFQKEAYFNRMRAEYLHRLEETKKNIAPRTFMMPSPTKRQTGSGDFFGCFGKVTAFSPLKGPKLPRVKEPSNMFSKPPKKGGSGYPDITFSPYPEYIESLYLGELQKYKENYNKHKQMIKHSPFTSAVNSKKYFDPNPYYVSFEDEGPTYVEPKQKIAKSIGTGIFIPSSPGKKPGGANDGYFIKYPPHSEDKYFPPLESVPRKMSLNVFYPQIRIRSMPTKSIVNYNVDFGVNAKNWRECGLIVYK